MTIVDNDYQEVYFDPYCKTCKHEKCNSYESPCEECLDNPFNLYSHRPVNWKAAKGFENYVFGKDDRPQIPEVPEKKVVKNWYNEDFDYEGEISATCISTVYYVNVLTHLCRYTFKSSKWEHEFGKSSNRIQAKYLVGGNVYFSCESIKLKDFDADNIQLFFVVDVYSNTFSKSWIYSRKTEIKSNKAVVNINDMFKHLNEVIYKRDMTNETDIGFSFYVKLLKKVNKSMSKIEFTKIMVSTEPTDEWFPYKEEK